MNYRVLHMLEQAGFKFTPDVMHKLPLFEKLVELERESIAKMFDENESEILWGAQAASAVRARGQVLGRQE